MDYARLALIAFVVALAPVGFIAGCMDEKARYDAHLALNKVLAEAQEQSTQARIKADQQRKNEADNAHKLRTRNLNRALADAQRELREHSSAGLMPPASGAAASGEGVGTADAVVCFARDRLRAGMEGAVERLRERSAHSAAFGASAIAVLETCATWAVNTHEAGSVK